MSSLRAQKSQQLVLFGSPMVLIAAWWDSYSATLSHTGRSVKAGWPSKSNWDDEKTENVEICGTMFVHKIYYVQSSK